MLRAPGFATAYGCGPRTASTAEPGGTALDSSVSQGAEPEATANGKRGAEASGNSRAARRDSHDSPERHRSAWRPREYPIRSSGTGRGTGSEFMTPVFEACGCEG